MAFSSSLLDRYIDHPSRVHALDARVKLLLTFGFILAVATLPPGAWLGLAGFTAMLWWAICQARIGLGTLLTRAIVALPFALVAISVVFTRTGVPLFQVPLGITTLTATDTGLILFTTIVFKSWLSVQAALLLTATTHFVDMLRALQALRLPTILVSILGFTYRYLFVLIDEAQRLLRARECRSAELPDRRSGGSIAWRATVVGRMVGTLFLRSYERSERIYVAMLSRGFDGEMRTLSPHPLAATERGILITGWAGFAAVTLLALVL